MLRGCSPSAASSSSSASKPRAICCLLSFPSGIFFTSARGGAHAVSPRLVPACQRASIPSVATAKGDAQKPTSTSTLLGPPRHLLPMFMACMAWRNMSLLKMRATSFCVVSSKAQGSTRRLETFSSPTPSTCGSKARPCAVPVPCPMPSRAPSLPPLPTPQPTLLTLLDVPVPQAQQ